jgi:hypothetical protein
MKIRGLAISSCCGQDVFLVTTSFSFQRNALMYLWLLFIHAELANATNGKDLTVYVGGKSVNIAGSSKQ